MKPHHDLSLRYPLIRPLLMRDLGLLLLFGGPGKKPPILLAARGS